MKYNNVGLGDKRQTHNKPMKRHNNLFVLKVPLITNQPTTLSVSLQTTLTK